MRTTRVRFRIAVALVVALALGGLAAGAAGATSSSRGGGRVTLASSVPAWAKASKATGVTAGSDQVGFRVYLGWRNEAGAEALARAVSDPSSGSYGNYLTPQQFRQQFAPSQTDVNAVESWLRSQGFRVDYVPQNNHYVSADGTVAQANAAFGTTLKDYSYDGLTLRSPSSELTIPASLAGVVEGVVGLDDSAALVHPDHVVKDAPPSAGFRNAPPCSAYWAEKIDTAQPGNYPYAPCGYTPSQLRGAYDVAGAIASGNDGTGVTVGIIDAYASPTIVQDANEYSSHYGLPQLNGSTFHQVVPPGIFRRPNNQAQSPSAWYGEETLDVEAVHSMAPGANIVYVGAPNNYSDLDAALNHVVDRHLADIVTNSYGFSGEALPPGYIKPYNDTLIQAVVEGITVTFSSGDDGDETGGTADPALATPDWPASSPWVTAVGGTSLAVGAANNYLFETGWATGRSSLLPDNTWSAPTFQYGSGGGTSRLFPQPAYQAGIVPNSLATAGGARPQPMRVVPDVSLVGDPNTGMRVGQTQTFSDGTYYDEYRIGGTSLSSPLFAGILALGQQRAGHPLGFANPLLYSLAGSGAYRDVVPPASQLGVVRVDYVNSENASDGLSTTLRLLGYDQVETIHTAPGYDDVTGIGSPFGTSFLDGVH